MKVFLYSLVGWLWQWISKRPRCYCSWSGDAPYSQILSSFSHLWCIYMFSVSDPRVLLLCKLWNLFHVKAWLSETNCLILKHLKETFTRLTRPEVAVCNYFPTQLLNEGILSESISPARLLLIHRKWESLTKERPSGISLQVFIERHCSFRSRL